MANDHSVFLPLSQVSSILHKTKTRRLQNRRHVVSARVGATQVRASRERELARHGETNCLWAVTRDCDDPSHSVKYDAHEVVRGIQISQLTHQTNEGAPYILNGFLEVHADSVDDVGSVTAVVAAQRMRLQLFADVRPDLGDLFGKTVSRTRTRDRLLRHHHDDGLGFRKKFCRYFFGGYCGLRIHGLFPSPFRDEFSG